MPGPKRVGPGPLRSPRVVHGDAAAVEPREAVDDNDDPAFVPRPARAGPTCLRCLAPQTPSEAYAAYKAGAPVQKIFPGVAGGAAWVKAVSAAMPMLKLNPTSVRSLQISP